MTRPLGKHQLRLLRVLAQGGLLVVPNKVSDSLERRGLAERLKPDAMVYITPDGHRAIADAMESGRIEYPPVLRRLGTGEPQP